MQLENLNWFPLFCISFQTGLFGFEISQSRPCKQKNVLLHERVLLLHCWQRYSCAYWNNETMISPISIVHDHLQNVMGIFYEYRIVSTYADWLNHADCVSLKPSPHWQLSGNSSVKCRGRASISFSIAMEKKNSVHGQMQRESFLPLVGLRSNDLAVLWLDLWRDAYLLFRWKVKAKVENLNLKVSKVEDSGEVTHRPLHGCVVKNRWEIEQRFACF